MATVQRDLHLDPDTLPWVEQTPGVWFKLLRASPSEERYTNLLKVAPGGLLARHRHPGPVEAWVIAGSWRYLEHDWVAGPGDYIYEPIGDVHTLVVDPAEEMITLFQVTGGVVYLDEHDEVVRIDTAQSKLDRYLEHCRAHGLEPANIVF
jgi:quercetin dioxygenase-like cupin family protein